MIDKDGAKELALPGRQATPFTPVSSPVPVPAAADQQPEAVLKTPTPVAPTVTPASTEPMPLSPLQPTPVAITNDDGSAPVDRRLMQRGFSHAFDELLQPGSTPQSAADTAPASGDRP